MNNNQKLLLRGLLFTILIPLVGIFIFYFAKFSQYGVATYFETLIENNLVAPVVSVSLVPSLLVFYYFLNRQRFKEGQGVILSVLLWGLVIVYFKFLA